MSSRLRSYRHSSLMVSVPYMLFHVSMLSAALFWPSVQCKAQYCSSGEQQGSLSTFQPRRAASAFKTRKENLSNKLHFITKTKMIIQTTKKRHHNSPNQDKQGTLPRSGPLERPDLLLSTIPYPTTLGPFSPGKFASILSAATGQGLERPSAGTRDASSLPASACKSV